MQIPSDHFSSSPTRFCMDLSYSLGCGRVFLPVSTLLSVRTAPHVDIFLIYLWKEVSSASFYSTILVSSLYIISFLKIWKIFISQANVPCVFKGSMLSYDLNFFDTQYLMFFFSCQQCNLCFKIFLVSVRVKHQIIPLKCGI